MLCTSRNSDLRLRGAGAEKNNYGSATLLTAYVQLFQWNGTSVSSVSSSDLDPHLDQLVRDTDPSISQRYGYGSGSFYHQAKVVRKKMIFCYVFKIPDEHSRIRIRIHYSEVWIRGSGSVPKFHGSTTIVSRPS